MEHTKGPWIVVSGAVETMDGIPIAYMDREIGNGTLPVERDENAKFIVRSCNSHYDLVKAIDAHITHVTSLQGQTWMNCRTGHDLLLAIQKAKGRE